MTGIKLSGGQFEAPNTWMPGPIIGAFFCLYLILDIYSRRNVGWEVHERESADLAASLVQRAVWAEGCTTRPLVLHADNGFRTGGRPMKGATMKAALEKPGITASCSRPRASNDNPFSEALFRTCKYRPDWPTGGFATTADAQKWVQGFATWYNAEHLHSKVRFVTPNMRHSGQEGEFSPNAPVSMQMPEPKTRPDGPGKSVTGSPSGPSGSTRNANKPPQK